MWLFLCYIFVVRWWLKIYPVLYTCTLFSYFSSAVAEYSYLSLRCLRDFFFHKKAVKDAQHASSFSSAVDVCNFFRSSHHCHRFRLIFLAFIFKSMEVPPTIYATYFLFARFFHCCLLSIWIPFPLVKLVYICIYLLLLLSHSGTYISGPLLSCVLWDQKSVKANENLPVFFFFFLLITLGYFYWLSCATAQDINVYGKSFVAVCCQPSERKYGFAISCYLKDAQAVYS